LDRAVSLKHVKVLIDSSPYTGYAENYVRSVLERGGYRVAQPKNPGLNETETGHPDFIVLGNDGGRVYVEAKSSRDSIKVSQLKWIVEHPDEVVIIYCAEGVESPEPEVGELEGRSRRLLNDKELQAMREKCGGERDRAILEFLRSTKCNTSEMLGVSISDVKLENRTVLLKNTRARAERKRVNGKRIYKRIKSIPRVVFFDEVAIEAISRYIELRRAARARDIDPLFTIDQNGNKDGWMVRHIIKGIAKAAGLPDWRDISPKVFWGSRITNMVVRK